MKNRINVLCATDRNFLYPAYVTIASVIHNHKRFDVRFFLIVDEDISKEDLDRLEKYVSSTGNSIEFLSLTDKSFDEFETCERFTKAAYFRLMAHKYLPQDADRVLYLDVDIVVDKDISEFYFMDFQDKYLIATSHNPCPDYYNMLNSTIVNLQAAGRGEFFNSGVIVFNLDKFREAGITEKDYVDAYNYCRENEIEVFYDQGLLNFMFYDKTLYLSSMDYNFRYSIPRDYASRLDPDREYKKAIIHYTGMKQPYKPWDIVFTDEEIEMFGDVPYKSDFFYVSKECNDLMKIWWEYARLTPVYEELSHDEKVKHKWFARNLMPIFLKYNVLLGKTPNKEIQKIFRDKVIVQYPEGFHHRAYKLGCALFAPYFWLRKRLQKKK